MNSNNNISIPYKRAGIKFYFYIHIQEIFAFRLTYYDVISDVTVFQYWVDQRTLHRDCKIELFESICNNVCPNDE